MPHDEQTLPEEMPKNVMASYKLTYVDRRSRGETIRLMLHAAGVEFEDIRLSVPEEYYKVPLEQRKKLPLLEVNGKKISQSYAIAKYVAREFGFAGKTSWEEALVDGYMELTIELMYDMRSVFLEKDEEKKKAGYKNMIEVTHPLFMKLFDEAIKANGTNYLVGDSLTVADLAVYNIFDTRAMNDPEALDPYPSLKANRKATESNPRIAAYLKVRKHTDV